MADVQTVFGNINSIISQTAESVAKVRTAIQGAPTPEQQAFPITLPFTQQATQGTNAVALLLLLVILGVIAYLVAREIR